MTSHAPRPRTKPRTAVRTLLCPASILCTGLCQVARPPCTAKYILGPCKRSSSTPHTLKPPPTTQAGSKTHCWAQPLCRAVTCNLQAEPAGCVKSPSAADADADLDNTLDPDAHAAPQQSLTQPTGITLVCLHKATAKERYRLQSCWSRTCSSSAVPQIHTQYGTAGSQCTKHSPSSPLARTMHCCVCG